MTTSVQSNTAFVRARYLVQEGDVFRSVGWAFFLTLGAAASAVAQNTTAKGEKVYADQRCALCHSIGDKGNKKGPLDEVGAKLSKDDIRAWLTDAKAMTAKTKAARKPDMKSYALPKDDLDALVAYMASLEKK